MRRFDIPPIDAAAARAAAERQRILTKPPGSLGRLEDVACRLAGIQGTALPTVRNRWIVVAAADHGVTGDSVSAYPQEVTAQMVLNFLSGGAAINVLARHCGARLMVVDAGIRGPELTEVGSRFHGNDGGEDGKDEGTDSNGEGTDSNGEGTDSNGEGTDSNGEGADGNDGGADGSDEGTDGNDKGADGNDVDTGGNDGGTGGNDEGTGLRTMRTGSGTANFAREPAMSLEQAKLSISNGAEVADDLARRGAHLVAGGDMGIGNTSSAAAICAAMTGTDPARVTGRGAGLDDAGLVRKVAVIRRGLDLHKPDPADPLGVLSAVGGFEIGFLAGLMLGLAERRVAIALDGFIVTSAALIAHALNPRVVDYIFACHLSVEPGHRVALERLGLTPLLDLNLGLGEGSGAALGMTIIDAAARLHAGMATFDEAAVSGRTGPSS